MFSQTFKTINIHDGKIYYGNPSEKRNPHICFNKNIEIKYKGQFKCFYCDMQFSSRNKLFTHLGFNNVDIRLKPNKDYEKFKKMRKIRKKIGKNSKKMSNAGINLKYALLSNSNKRIKLNKKLYFKSLSNDIRNYDGDNEDNEDIGDNKDNKDIGDNKDNKDIGDIQEILNNSIKIDKKVNKLSGILSNIKITTQVDSKLNNINNLNNLDDLCGYFTKNTNINK
jgi:hypothetical protein